MWIQGFPSTHWQGDSLLWQLCGCLQQGEGAGVEGPVLTAIGCLPLASLVLYPSIPEDFPH